MAEEPDRDREGWGCRLPASVVATLAVVLAAEWLAPGFIPFSLFQFWKLGGTPQAILGTAWPLLAWGVGVTAVQALLSHNRPDVNRHAELILVTGSATSLYAGVVEELTFRWLFFYGEMVLYQVANWLLFGWAGQGLLQWFTLNISGPLANVLTLGYLAPYLLGSLGWAVGAAIISSNGKFRNGHVYEGLFGWVNAWFLGMFMFYLVFRYGLFAAMLVHFLYDLFIYFIAYADAAIERAMGWI